MSNWAAEEAANKENEDQYNDDNDAPSNWVEDEDPNKWKDDDNMGGNTIENDIKNKMKKKEPTRKIIISKNFKLNSTVALSSGSSNWILIKSIFLWIYIILLCIGIINNNGTQTVYIFGYEILFILWILFFRSTSTAKWDNQFYPFVGTTKAIVIHIILFTLGLGGIDLVFLERKRKVMRESIMQYKVIEFDVILSMLMILIICQGFWWSNSINEIYYDNLILLSYKTIENSSVIIAAINIIPLILLLCDSIIHYSYVYQHKFWDEYKYKYTTYIIVLIILLCDILLRTLTIQLLINTSSWIYIAFLIYYFIFIIIIWIFALRKSVEGQISQLILALKKLGGKLIPALFISMWSVTGILQILPTISLSSTNIQKQNIVQKQWAKNILRLESFIRLLISVISFTTYNVINNNDSKSSLFIYIIMILIVIYPFSIEILFQTPFNELLRGSFYLIQHIDPITSIPNLKRYHKDIEDIKWKNGLIIPCIRHYGSLRKKFGKKCANKTVVKMLQRIMFEFEDIPLESKIYSLSKNKFIIITSFDRKDEFIEALNSLCKINITVLRPSDYNPTSTTNENSDDDMDELL